MQNSTDPSQVKWDWLATEDKGIVDAKLCFAGQFTPNIIDFSCTKSAITFVLEAEVMALSLWIWKNEKVTWKNSSCI